MIHGPGNKGNLNLLYQLVKSGIPYPVKAFNNKRSFVSIENLCFIIRELIEGEVEQGLYHVADDEPTYTHDLVKLIDRKSTRLNSSHVAISYAVFCLKKKKINKTKPRS